MFTGYFTVTALLLLTGASGFDDHHTTTTPDMRDAIRLDLQDAILINESSSVELKQGQELLSVAVVSGTNARIPLSGARQTVAFQNTAGLFIDCDPWSSQFEGGTVQWIRQRMGCYICKSPYN